MAHRAQLPPCAGLDAPDILQSVCACMRFIVAWTARPPAVAVHTSQQLQRLGTEAKQCKVHACVNQMHMPSTALAEHWRWSMELEGLNMSTQTEPS